MVNKEEKRTRYDSADKVLHTRRVRTRRVDASAAQRARRRAGATLPGSGDFFFGFTGPKVVFRALAWPNEPIDEASQTIQQPSLPKYGKNEHSGDANCQTGSRNMAATLFSTQRPRLSIRLQTHYGVYHLEPLQSYLPGVLTLRDCDGRKTWQKYLKSERCFAITGITGDTATIRAKIRHKQSSRVR